MAQNPTGSSMIGKSIRRVEDDRLLRGKGQYLADLSPQGTLHAVFVRSPHAHAKIVRIDTSAARAFAGVIGVFTAADTTHTTEPICVSGEVHTPERLQRELKPLDRLHPIPLFPSEKVTYVGHPVAMIVAESRVAALDALELVEVEYEHLPVVTDPVEALKSGAPLVEPAWNTNLALSVATGKGDPDAAFAGAAVVVEEEFRTHRYVASPMETRGILTVVEPFSGALTVWASTQTPHVLQTILASTLRMPVERIRVVACDVGGGFGQKGIQAVEDALVPFAARELGRPVRWVEERGENLTAAAHARDQVHRIAMAADKDGNILAVRDDVIVNFGAYNVIGLVVPYNTLSHLLGAYHVPNAHISVRAALTNTCFTTPYRGAGRPEAVFAMERIIDRLAAKLGMDPADAAEFAEEMGLGATRGADALIQAGYRLLDLVTFFTGSGPPEARAWPIRRGTPADQAAGKIHSDMERGFIRAEVVAWDQLVECGSFSKAREQALARMEGKDYIVQEGDVMQIRFNV